MAVPIIRRSMKQGQTDTIVVDLGDNAAVGSSPIERIVLNAGESFSSGTATVTQKPSGASDPTLGTPTSISTNTECNDRIVESGEGFSMSIVTASGQALGLYVIDVAIVTSASRTIPVCIKVDVESC